MNEFQITLVDNPKTVPEQLRYLQSHWQSGSHFWLACWEADARILCVAQQAHPVGGRAGLLNFLGSSFHAAEALQISVIEADGHM